jgi:hypothetical protein
MRPHLMIYGPRVLIVSCEASFASLRPHPEVRGDSRASKEGRRSLRMRAEPRRMRSPSAQIDRVTSASHAAVSASTSGVSSVRTRA